MRMTTGTGNGLSAVVTGFAIFAIFAIAPNVSAETLLVGNKGEDTVSFIDLATGIERARAATAKAPHEIAISPDGKRAAVVAYGGTTVDIFDVASAEFVKRIDLTPNAAPHGIVWLRDGRIVMAAEKSRSVVILDPRSGRFRTVPTDQTGTHMVASSPDQRYAYATNVGAGSISVIDLKRGSKVRDIAIGGNPEGLAITPDGRELWVGDNSAPRLRVVDLASGQTIVTMTTDPVAIRVAISPDGKTAITSNIGAGSLSVFDVASRKLVRTVVVSGVRDAIQVTATFTRDGRHVLVAETGRGTIAEVDPTSGQVLRRLVAGKNGDGIGIAP